MTVIVKSVTVPATVETAFATFVGRPLEWLPPGHTFLRDPSSVTLEARAGGRFVERAPDGTEAVRGTILAAQPPHGLTMTWRVGPRWRPLPDDVDAVHIAIAFTPLAKDSTEVRLTYDHLPETGEFANQLRAALDAPGPGESLTRYASLFQRPRKEVA